MLTKRLIVRAAFAGSVVVALTPVLAQDREEFDGLRQRLRFEQSFGTGNNLGLEVPSEGTTSLATTRLTYGLESKTAIQDIAFTVGGALRLGSVAVGNNIETGLTDPLVGLRYNRDTGNASFSFNANYRQSDISLALPVWTFLDQDGFVVPPRDFLNVRGSGQRRAYRIYTELETGKQAPFGLRFFATANGARYQNTTDPGLTDFDFATFGASALFRFDALTTGFVDLRYDQYNTDDLLNTERQTRTIELGFDRQISERARLVLRAGYTDNDTYETIAGQRLKTQRSGPSGRIGYLTDLPNGFFNSTFDLIQRPEGQRGTLRFTRSLQLPRGNLSANIGLTSFDSTEPRVIGGINWTHNLPASQISLRLNRDVFVDSNDNDRFTTLLIAGYQHQINELSSLGADLSYTHSESGPGIFAQDTKRTNFRVTYQHRLTREWNLNAGVEYRMIDEQFPGKADSNAVFFGFGRNFDF